MLYRARAWFVAAALCLAACSSAATQSEPIITNLSFDTGRTVEVMTSRPLGGAAPQVARFEELPGVGYSGRWVFASGIAQRVMFKRPDDRASIHPSYLLTNDMRRNRND